MLVKMSRQVTPANHAIDALNAQMPSMDGIAGDQVDQTVKFCDAAAMEDYFFQTRRTPSNFACDENSYRETVR